MPAFDVVRRWQGRTVVDRRGVRVGRLSEVLYDTETDAPGWGLVNLADIGVDTRLVPLRDMTAQGVCLALPYDLQAVRAAPTMPVGGTLTLTQEAALYIYWRLPWSAASLADRHDDLADTPDPTTADGVYPLHAHPRFAAYQELG